MFSEDTDERYIFNNLLGGPPQKILTLIQFE